MYSFTKFTILDLSLLPINISIPKSLNSSLLFSEEQPHTTIIDLGFSLLDDLIIFLLLLSAVFVTEQVLIIIISEIFSSSVIS